jgi:hypothetical protein
MLRVAEEPTKVDMNPKAPCAAVATTLVIASTAVLIHQAALIERNTPLIYSVLACLAVPGLALGSIISMVASRNIHNTSFWLVLLVSVPVDWVVYYFIAIRIVRLWRRFSPAN